jgi:hypothetical protein
MKNVKRFFGSFIFFLLCCFAGQTLTAQTLLSPQDKRTISNFEKSVKKYTKLRERIEKKLPKLSKDADGKEIDKHKMTFQKSVQTARSGAKQGEIFTPAASELIRKIIKSEFKGKERVELRETVLEADTKGVPLKINYPYPDFKEQIEMSPSLLLSLPQLPKQLRYRFVGRNLLLMDRENELIVDYMTNALP